MKGDILKVKNNIPPLANNIMSRPGVFKHIEEDLEGTNKFSRKVTLVSAPAGFGKTTLVRKWLAGREDHTAWYSLDEGDNEPKRFWMYLISALQSVDINLGKNLLEILKLEEHTTETSKNAQHILTQLINDILDYESLIYLVLDDYHFINETQIHKDIVFLIENLPSNIHLFVTTRSDPPWPLAKWRGKNKMLDIRINELKFTKEEANLLYSRLEGIQLTEKQLNTLYNKTEGWITGLQLAAFSFSKCNDLDSYVESFAGNHRYILHFLKEEVFNQQPDSTKEFLLYTSILNRFSASLCDAVTGREDSAKVLNQLESDNLFVIPMDEQGLWYRYHHLFSDHLVFELKRDYPKEYPLLCVKAGDWYLKEGEPGEAIRFFKASDNLEKVAHILDKYFERISNNEGTGQVVSYLESIPLDLLKKYPRLVAFKAFYLVILRKDEDPKQYIELANELSYKDPIEQKEYLGILAAVKAFQNMNNYNFSKTLEYANKALELLPENDSFWRLSVNIVSGDIKLFSCNPNEAYPYYLKAFQINQKHKQHSFLLSTGIKVGVNLYYLGRLKETEELCKNMIDTAQKEGLSSLSKVGNFWALMGEIHRQKGNLNKAGELIEKGLSICKLDKLYSAWNYLFKVYLSFSKSKYQDALQSIRQIKAINSEVKLPFHITFTAIVWEARILAQEGELSKAKEVLVCVGVSEESKVKAGLESGYLILGRIMLEDDKDAYKGNKIIEGIEEIEKFSKNGGHLLVLLETRILKACLEEKLGDREKAELNLKEALKIGYESECYQIFIDERKQLGSVIVKIFDRIDNKFYSKSSEMEQYVQKIYRGLSLEKGLSLKEHPEYVEDLTSREVEILNLISQGLTNNDICEKLYLTISTVKWHTSNIYGKLGVKGRTQAIAKARKLNLLQ